MFTNKHVVIALIVAPILAILAWFAIGNLMGEQPHSAEPGVAYPLVARSNCRYASGRCDLENEDFSLSLHMDDELTLLVSSEYSLQGVLVSVSDASRQLPPIPMLALAGDRKRWKLQLSQQPQPKDVIRLVAATQDNAYFGETSTQFIEP